MSYSQQHGGNLPGRDHHPTQFLDADTHDHDYALLSYELQSSATQGYGLDFYDTPRLSSQTGGPGSLVYDPNDDLSLYGPRPPPIPRDIPGPPPRQRRQGSGATLSGMGEHFDVGSGQQYVPNLQSVQNPFIFGNSSNSHHPYDSALSVSPESTHTQLSDSLVVQSPGSPRASWDEYAGERAGQTPHANHVNHVNGPVSSLDQGRMQSFGAYDTGQSNNDWSQARPQQNYAHASEQPARMSHRHPPAASSPRSSAGRPRRHHDRPVASTVATGLTPPGTNQPMVLAPNASPQSASMGGVVARTPAFVPGQAIRHPTNERPAWPGLYPAPSNARYYGEGEEEYYPGLSPTQQGIWTGDAEAYSSYTASYDTAMDELNRGIRQL